MKKVATIISSVALLATLSTSCKKEYRCECCVGSSCITTDPFKETKKKAEKKCKDAESEMEAGTANMVDYTCKVK